MADPAKSSDLNVGEAAEHIGEISSADELRAYIDGDDRKSVQDAAAQRLGELGVATPAEATAAAQPGTPLSSGGQGRKLVRVPWPHDRFEHGVDGVPAITAEGVEVESSKVEQLLKVAEANGIALEEVGA